MHSQPTPPYEGEIDLFQLFETIWEGKWLMVAITALLAPGGVTAIKRIPTEHNGSVQIVPQSQAIGGLVILEVTRRPG